MNIENDDQTGNILGNIPERLIIAADGVDSSVQQEYTEYADNLDFGRYSEEDISAISQSLFRSSTSLKYKKENLAVLARLGTLEAYRTIERFLETAEQTLKDWCILALQECRMFLESSLSGRDVGILMTGLGGENNRLRYFFVIRSRRDAIFTSTQKKTVERSFSYTCSQFNSILEETQFNEYYVTVKMLIPMDIAIVDIVEDAIRECNIFGDFLDGSYYVTNTKIPTEVEIQHYLQGRSST